MVKKKGRAGQAALLVYQQEPPDSIKTVEHLSYVRVDVKESPFNALSNLSVRQVIRFERIQSREFYRM